MKMDLVSRWKRESEQPSGDDLWGKLDALEELGDEMAIELERLHRTLKQMREDFRRIEMMAGQHCPVPPQISATI